MTGTWKTRRKRSYRFSGVEKSRKLVALAKLSFLGVIAVFLLLFVVLPLFAFNLPSPDKIVRREGFSTKILDRNGEPLYDIYEDKRRTPVSLEDIPLYLKQATIAIEDKNFYKHSGFDPFGMLRGLSRIFTRGYAQGGSTLTQQLVKNVLLSSERSVLRKLREFILAVQIERKYSKDEILQMYLNEAPYGGTSWGVESASEIYFGKKTKDLNLVESAILAGLPQRPSVYSPYSSTPDAYKSRAKDVLRRMKEDDYITGSQEEAALIELEDVKFQEKGSSFKAPHFVQYVQKILEERYGEEIVELGGLKVTTTLDLALQEEAQKIVFEEIEKVKSQRITNGGAVVMDSKTGEILTMVGSRNFSDPDYDGQYNVTTALRQPGSSFKPITYATAFKEGYTPSTMIMDVFTKFPGGEGQPDYEPVNYDGKFRGPVQLRYALGNSINVPAVKLLALVGIKDVLQMAYDLGIESLPPTKETLSRVGLSLTLGGGEVKLIEMTNAYGIFFNGGKKIEPISILKVEDADGKVLEETKFKEGKQVILPEIAFLISHILSDNSARTEVFGPNSTLNIPGRQVAVKTGTTNDKKDNWTIGGTPQRVVGVWVGNNDNSSMLNVASGISGASPIWRRIIISALSGISSEGFISTDKIVTASVDTVSGYRAHDEFSSRSELFIKGFEPKEDIVHVKLKVCKSDGKLATPSDIAGGNYDEKEYFLFKEEDPTAGSGQPNRWQEGILNWLNGQADERYHPPTDYCGSSNPVNVDFSSPNNESQINSNEFGIKLSPQSTSKITRVELYIDDKNVRNFDEPPYEYNATGITDGVHKLKATARDEKGNQNERTITVGINVPWNWEPSLSPSPVPTTTG